MSFLNVIKQIILILSLMAFSIANASQPDKPQVLRWAHVYEVSHPLHHWALWASKQLFEKTQGRYSLQVYASSSLGKEAYINQSISLGTIDIIYTGTSFAAQAYRPLGISEMPYIFSDFQHWQRFITSPVFADMKNEYSANTQGNVILSSSYYGVRHLSSNRPVFKPEDIKGMKIRTPGASVYQLFPLSLGAKPSPISFSEVYLAIQQGVVDAQENPLITIRAKKFYEVQTNINLTGHILGSILTVMNGDTWNSLDAEDKLVFSEVLQEAAVNTSKTVLNNEEQLASWFKEQGLQVNHIDRNAFRDKVLKYYESSSLKFNKDIYEKIQSL